MNCPTCDHQLRVTNTRHADGAIRRRRACGRCGFTGWTAEVFEDADVAAAAVARRELKKISEAVGEALARLKCY